MSFSKCFVVWQGPVFDSLSSVMFSLVLYIRVIFALPRYILGPYNKQA